jgi:bifunctional UDP-N-acetylglucosamine pyrophosphorylase / glucosamine-1-phosphate N-acetyltransferase
MANRTTTALILAAGLGKRMNSDLPKVLHEIAGRPMIDWVIEHILQAGIEQIVVVLGGELGLFENALNKYSERVVVARQAQRRGTADAVAAGGYALEGLVLPPYADGSLISGQMLKTDDLLICTGDAPNIQPATLRGFVAECHQTETHLGVIGMEHPTPTGYGRLVFGDQGKLSSIVEEKDANERQKAIQLCNSGVVFGRANELFSLLGEVTSKNTQNEYYLTDCFELASKRGWPINVYQTGRWQEFEGVNNPQQLARLEQLILQQ